MMSAEQLALVGSRLVKRCGTRDPFEIAADIGVEVMFCDNFGPLKGMYRVIKRNRFIFINNQLSEQMQRIVCAHELGHDQLHRNLAKDNPLREFMLYDMRTKPEYEANIVAAEILLDNDELLHVEVAVIGAGDHGGAVVAGIPADENCCAGHNLSPSLSVVQGTRPCASG